jgi:hypothetical protein
LAADRHAGETFYADRHESAVVGGHQRLMRF